MVFLGYLRRFQRRFAIIDDFNWIFGDASKKIMSCFNVVIWLSALRACDQQSNIERRFANINDLILYQSLIEVDDVNVTFCDVSEGIFAIIWG